MAEGPSNPQISGGKNAILDGPGRSGWKKGGHHVGDEGQARTHVCAWGQERRLQKESLAKEGAKLTAVAAQSVRLYEEGGQNDGLDVKFGRSARIAGLARCVIIPEERTKRAAQKRKPWRVSLLVMQRGGTHRV